MARFGSRCSRSKMVMRLSYWTKTLGSYYGETTGIQGLSFGVLLSLTKVNKLRENQLHWSK